MSGKFARELVDIASIDGVDPSVAAAVFFALDALIQLQPVIKDKAISAGVRSHQPYKSSYLLH